MVSTTGLRPTHYETLGIEPDADLAAIEQAFRRKVSAFAPHSFGSVAGASVAYETLKDPAKRRAYDEKIGLIEPPAPPPVADFWTGRPYSMRAGRVIGARPLGANAGAAIAPVLSPPAPVRAVPQPVPFMAAPRADPEPLAVVEPAPVMEPEPEPSVEVEAGPIVPVQAEITRPASVSASAAAPTREPISFSFADAETGELDGRRTAMIAGGLVVAVGLAGAWLGWSAGGTEPGSAALSEVRQELPTPTPPGGSVINVSDADRAAPAPQPQRFATFRARPSRTVPAPAEPPAEAAGIPSSPPDLTSESATIAEATPSEPATASAAALPLSRQTIARTIERIGYSCGSVSAAAPTGSGGVFTVTCSSGQSFRASPRGGRYRFRKI